jgi:hypothetical protein
MIIAMLNGSEIWKFFQGRVGLWCLMPLYNNISVTSWRLNHDHISQKQKKNFKRKQ